MHRYSTELLTKRNKILMYTKNAKFLVMVFYVDKKVESEQIFFY